MHDGLGTRERKEGRHMHDGLDTREREGTCMMAWIQERGQAHA